jgi:hypothetical protein
MGSKPPGCRSRRREGNEDRNQPRCRGLGPTDAQCMTNNRVKSNRASQTTKPQMRATVICRACCPTMDIIASSVSASAGKILVGSTGSFPQSPDYLCRGGGCRLPVQRPGRRVRTGERSRNAKSDHDRRAGCALGVLAPATALGKAGGTDRPLQGVGREPPCLTSDPDFHRRCNGGHEPPGADDLSLRERSAHTHRAEHL